MARLAAVAALLLLAAIVPAQAIKVSLDKTSLTLKKDSSTIVTFRLNEPIICPDQGRIAECAVVIEIDNQSPAHVAMDNCIVKWQWNEWSQPRYLRVSAVNNFINEGALNFKLVTQPVISESKYYKGFDAADITIRTEPKPSGACRGTGDPHYTTFDGMYWHVYTAGRYVLYSNRNSNNDLDFEVQVSTYAYPARHCAFAAKEGNDIFVYSFCGGPHRHRRTCGTKECQRGGFPKVSISGGQYSVTFASGRRVLMSSINIYVNAPSRDYQAGVGGICGNFDGNRNNDSPCGGCKLHDLNQLLDHQKPKRDLFNWYPSSIVDPVPPSPHVQECTYVPPPFRPPILTHPDAEDITDLLKDVQKEDDEDPIVFDFSDDGEELPDFMSEEAATNLCTPAIENSNVAKACKMVVAGFDTIEFVEDCVVDLVRTGNEESIALAILAMEARCAALAAAGDTSGWETDNDGAPVPPEELRDNLCPATADPVTGDLRTCNNHGTCKNVACTCEAGWSGADCGVNQNDAPTATSVVHRFCDTRSGKGCGSPAQAGQANNYVNVVGSNIWNAGNNLKCRFGDANSAQIIITDALYLGVGEVLCALPAISLADFEPITYPVSLTTDGQTYGPTSATFTWYDGVCDVCTEAAGCATNPASCTIEGKCYLETQANADNICLQCQPAVTTSAWSYAYDNHVECGPSFPSSILVQKVAPEAAKKDAVIFQADASNSKVAADPNHELTYELADDVEDLFALDAATGELSLTRDAVDLPASFNNAVLIHARDQTGNVASMTVVVEFIKVEEDPESEDQTFTVGELAAVGHAVGTFAATTETASVSFAFQSQVQGHVDDFVIDAATGAITVGKALDFETLAHYQMLVRITNAEGVSIFRELTITVEDQPEAPTAILLASDGVAENQAAGAVVGTLSVEDADGGDVVFSVAAGSAADVTVDGTTLKTARVFNYETEPTITVTVVATDAANAALSYTQALTLAVVDVNEAPRNIRLSQTTFSEADALTRIATVLVDDDDNEADPTRQIVACTVTEDAGDYFEISNGGLVLVKKLDHESDPNPSITIVCADDGEPTAVSEPKTIELTVLNANDAPEDVAFVGAGSVPEDFDTVQVIDTITATDYDADSGDLTFALAGSRFVLVGTPACAKIAAGATRCTQAFKLAAGEVLDHETAAEETVTVTSTDASGIQAVDMLTLTVTDVNEAPTGVQWVDGDNTVGEDAQDDDIVGQLIAIDQDRNQEFTYTLTQGGDVFYLQSESGIRRRSVTGVAATVRVKDASLIDFETAASIALAVEVVDNGTPALSVTATTEVDVADEPVEVYANTVGTTSASVPEDAPDGTEVLSLVMTGDDRRDAPFNLAYTLALVDDSMGHFALQGDKIVVAKVLDHEDLSLRVIQVSVTVSGAGALPAEVVTYHDLQITVGDVNEKPVFAHAAYTVTVGDDAATGQTQSVQPAALSATDPDAGAGAVTYEVVGGDAAAMAALAVDATTGAVRTKVQISDATLAVGVYTLTVRATSGGLSSEVTLTVTVQDDCAGVTTCFASETCEDIFNDYQCCKGGVCITSVDAANRPPETSSGDNRGAGAGLVAGVVVAVVALLVLVALVVIRRRQQNNADSLFKGDESAIYTANPTYRAPSEGATYAAVSRNPHFVPGVSNPMYEWYRPDMTRQECTETLMAADDGAFVVRDSKATPGWHMLGVKTSGAVVHEKIKMNEDGMYELLPASNARQPRFADVPALVAHYGEPRPDVPYVLTLNFSNPMYGLGAQSAGQYHYAPGMALPNDPAAPHVPLKERQKDSVAQLAAAEGDIYGNTTEARVAMSDA